MQKVTRTRPTNSQYYYEPRSFEYLAEYLESGYRVVMCNKIGEDLEYILEKEDKICERYYSKRKAKTWQEQAALARQIANLPERTDV